MKTPRELLLERHQGAQARLNETRQRALATLFPPPRKSLAGWLLEGWQEVFWSCRKAWLGLAAAWVVIVLANLTMDTTTSSKGLAANASRGQDVRLLLAAQRKLQLELLDSPAVEENHPASPSTMKPRSERRHQPAAA